MYRIEITFRRHTYFVACLIESATEGIPGSARIVNVSSIVHWGCSRFSADDANFQSGNYGAFQAYMRSKLANILFTRELAQRLINTGYNVTYKQFNGLYFGDRGSLIHVSHEIAYCV